MTIGRLGRLTLGTVLLVALAADGRGQFVGPSVFGDQEFSLLGLSSNAGCGDLNNDGHEDFISGAYQHDENGFVDCGAAFVFSGLDGSVIYSFFGEGNGHWFGRSVDGGMDVNGDEVPDLLVGAPRADFSAFDAGSVYVFSGATGELIHRLDGPTMGDQFGYSVALIADASLDGLADLAVGAPTYQPNNEGVFRVYEGMTWNFMMEVVGQAIDERLGRVVAYAGDVNGDGLGDVIAANRTTGSVERVVVVSPVNDQILWDIPSWEPGDRFGTDVSRLGDLNLDGLDDFLVGAPGSVECSPGGDGRVYVVSGGTGIPLYSVCGGWGASLGASLTALGDITGDGRPDFAAQARGEAFVTIDLAGVVHLFSGADGSAVASTPGGSLGDAFGEALGSADTNGDGLMDVLAGQIGQLRVIQTNTPFSIPVCQSTPNSTGRTATIEAQGTNSVSMNNLYLVSRQVPADVNGLFIYSPSPAATPLGNGTLCLSSAQQGFINRLSPLTSTSSYVLSHLVDVDAPPAPESMIVPGSSWCFQAWFRDPAAGGAGFDFSDALCVLFSP